MNQLFAITIQLPLAHSFLSGCAIRFSRRIPVMGTNTAGVLFPYPDTDVVTVSLVVRPLAICRHKSIDAFFSHSNNLDHPQLFSFRSNIILRIAELAV